MSYLNKLQLIGNVTREVSLEYTQGGTAKAIVNVAVDRDYKPEGQDKPDTDFFRVQLWRKQAENAANYLKVGAKIYVEGRLQNRSYDKDGQKHYVTDIIADKIKYLTWPKKDGPQNQQAQQNQPAQDSSLDEWQKLGREVKPGDLDMFGGKVDDDSEIPF